MVLVLHVSVVKLTYKWGKNWLSVPSGLRIMSPSLIPVLSTPVPGVHKHKHHGTLMQISFFALFLPCYLFSSRALLSGCCWQTGESSQSSWSTKLVCTWAYWLPVLQCVKCMLWNKYCLLIKNYPTIQDPVNNSWNNVFNTAHEQYSLKQLYSPAQ